ncbi:MAG: DUF3488 domain-containing protein [Sulfurimonas sp.]|nr:DUF3488 domain-containing protein [Sulfurimonas sp.]
MQFFVSLVSSLLIYAVTLQRLTQEINIYLKISPALLMLLSFFFFESITMLLYAIFTLFVFVLLNIWSRMNTTLIDVIKLTSQLFALSLPAVVILFLVFPRISFEKAEFGFKAGSYTQSGYNENLHLSSNEIRLSNKVVMEVFFKDKNISDNSLYFRGSTLYKQNGLNWEKASENMQADKLVKTNKLIKYDITLYPHAKKWIYALDMPTRKVEKAELKSDYTLLSKKPLYNKTRYKLHSALSYKLISKNLDAALEVDLKKSEKTYKALKNLKDSNLKDSQKAIYLMNFFRDQNLSYTLKPTKINLENFTDSFLFEGKNGYCTHFASAFTTSARLLGIPSRIVTGFKPSKKNMINNYLLVKSSDAHAWVELYLNDIGWVRFDPTTTASQNLVALNNIQKQVQLQNTLFQKINLNFMYVKYIIDSWILDFNRSKQLSILENLLNDTLYLIKFILAVGGVFLLSFLIFISIKSPRCKDKIMCEMNKLLKILKKHKLVKKDSETMELFLIRAEERLNIPLSDVSKIYHTLKYAKNNKDMDVKLLRSEIKKFSDLKNA